jgi:hypothetical protein
VYETNTKKTLVKRDSRYSPYILILNHQKKEGVCIYDPAVAIKSLEGSLMTDDNMRSFFNKHQLVYKVFPLETKTEVKTEYPDHASFVDKAVDFIEKAEYNPHFKELMPGPHMREMMVAEGRVPEFYIQYIARLKELGMNLISKVEPRQHVGGPITNYEFITYSPDTLNAKVFQYIPDPEHFQFATVKEESDGVVSLHRRHISKYLVLITDNVVVMVTDEYFFHGGIERVTWTERPIKIDMKEFYEKLYKQE